MRYLILLATFASWIFAADELPLSWVDSDTGHRVHRLTREPGSSSLYFNVNAYTPDGRHMVYVTPDRGLGVIELQSFTARPLVPGPVGGGPGAVVVGRKTGTVYYFKRENDPGQGALWACDISSGKSRKITDLPRRGGIFSINADETLGVGSYIMGDGKDYAGRDAGQATASRSAEEPRDKGKLMRERLAARLPMVVFTVDLHSGTTKVLFASTDWIDHLQFSPTEPTLLMYAHQGPWHQVEKLWTIRTDGSENRHITPRMFETEGHGHQWWDTQAPILWYDLHLIGQHVGFLANYDTRDGARTWYHYKPEYASIHFNRSPDGTLFAGDGSKAFGAQWIYLFRPEKSSAEHKINAPLIHTGVLSGERLVNMSKHDYRLEPNVNFTPDGKYVIFRSNMLGDTHIFAVEVAKAQ